MEKRTVAIATADVVIVLAFTFVVSGLIHISSIALPGSTFDVPGFFGDYTISQDSLGFYAVWAFIGTIFALAVDATAVILVLYFEHRR